LQPFVVCKEKGLVFLMGRLRRRRIDGGEMAVWPDQKVPGVECAIAVEKYALP